jgi:hypothetical protein
MANVKRKIIKKAAQWIKSRANSTDNMTKGPIDRRINVFGIKRGTGVENIPDNLMTRPKPGQRGTLGLTKAEKEAAKKRRQKELGVSSRPVPKNPNKSNVPAPPRYTKSTGTNKGGQQLNPGERRKY